LLAEIAFSVAGRSDYDPRITEGHIGVLAVVDEALVPEVESALQATGAHHMQTTEGGRLPNPRPLVRIVFAGAFAAIPTVIGLLFAYAVLILPLPNQMVEQSVTGFEQGPRLAAPAAAIPVQGPVLIAGQPATEPLPATADSLQRGQVLFNINCVMCHGQEGTGNGTLGGYFTPKPADLTNDPVQNLSDANIYMVLTNGWGIMPPMAENLSVSQRWDVVNYVRSLKK
jgi:mono/diheme cytochrome c family protein